MATCNNNLKRSRDEFESKHPKQMHFDPVPSNPHKKHQPIHTYSSTYPPPLPPLPPHLAQCPFLHASAARNHQNLQTYEKLEFLGDAYLELLATRLIYARFPALAVGRQSALREKLVRNSTLAKFATEYRFESRLIIENKVNHMTGKAKEKVLGDMMEAYLGAIVLAGEEAGEEDSEGKTKSSFQIAEEWMTALWIPIILQEDPNMQIVVNRKEELQRVIGGKFVKLEYENEEAPRENHGAPGMQSYTVGLYLTGWGYERKRIGRGVGINKKEAGSKAAAYFLENEGELLAELVEKKRKHDEERKKVMQMEMGKSNGRPA